ncbi:MAG: hypothetical protein OHK006_11420 [Thermodesulfovibrionales bacterium]
MEKVIIAVDLGHFRAYRMIKENTGSAKVKLIESYDSVETHGKLSDKVSDSAGRFAQGGGRNGSAKGYGEPHNIETEMDRKVIRLIAKDINAILTREGKSKWFLAAGEKINSQILDNLDPDVRSRLEKNILSNLTKTDKSELLRHFA